MQPFVTELTAKVIRSQDLAATLNDLVKNKSVESLLGSITTSQGLALLFFSPRFNKEYLVTVKSADSEYVLGEINKRLLEEGN